MSGATSTAPGLDDGELVAVGDGDDDEGGGRRRGREEEDEKSQESSIFWDIGGRQDSLDKEGVVHTHIM